ncbi:MAG: SagB/ThcOx family dehydrogenase [Erysipelotrichaceae bacterium]|nr:SagB/ThcOx family dehydrogenase [Erysipelotrichaceae bacterium]
MDETLIKKKIETGRAWLRTGYGEEDQELSDYQTDQQLKKKQPPLVKEAMSENVIGLPMDFEGIETQTDFLTIVNRRSSHRVYTGQTMSLKQLSYLLWCIQGVKEIRGKSYATLRTVPCGGARHPFETYMAIQNVEGLKDGLYHYLPMGHKIELLKEPEDLKGFIGTSLMGQVWANKGNVIFYFSIVFYRSEWRYGIYAHRGLMTDAGHITENLYLALTALGLGGCAIGAVDGKYCDQVFGLDGEEESIVYAMPIGTVSEEDRQKEQDFYAFVKEQGL